MENHKIADAQQPQMVEKNKQFYFYKKNWCKFD